MEFFQTTFRNQKTDLFGDLKNSVFIEISTSFLFALVVYQFFFRFTNLSWSSPENGLSFSLSFPSSLSFSLSLPPPLSFFVFFSTFLQLSLNFSPLSSGSFFSTHSRLSPSFSFVFISSFFSSFSSLSFSISFLIQIGKRRKWVFKRLSKSSL